ncbi:DUF2891 domain-containing protein [Halomicroarcula sp. F13]|uniref:DUF2891 domain-containing protein n=1 Tax=Haloarcula rubra TaxID=2487747 RepID=A0AAW4PPM0_9EURY|nr:DUF2891 domain-containing protein [Halomicroarcula rubra]MBX0323558.1 DUF2891 domain-containing protein [Halomicroarcula rubra]
MEPLADLDPETAVSGHGDWVETDLRTALARHPLDCVDTEYPHYVRDVEGPDDVPEPAEQHPTFHGCYDWHSAVHSHWTLVRQLRVFDDHPVAGDIVATLDERLTPENVAAEVDHLEANPGFEQPYGWAWLLRLAAELELSTHDRAADWRAALRPLEELVVDLTHREYLPVERPIRVGTHGNTAFALSAFLDYARVTGDDDLADSVATTARQCFRDDREYPLAYEPLGWDFVSPALTEADLLRRVLDGDEFADWFDRFLPGLASDPDGVLPDPVGIEEEDGLSLHLVGLNLSRAWCLAGVAETLEDHPAADTLSQRAARHAESGIGRAFTDDYAGAHWLSSFVLYLLTRHDGGIAPE